MRTIVIVALPTASLTSNTGPKTPSTPTVKSSSMIVTAAVVWKPSAGPVVGTAAPERGFDSVRLNARLPSGMELFTTGMLNVFRFASGSLSSHETDPEVA